MPAAHFWLRSQLSYESILGIASLLRLLRLMDPKWSSALRGKHVSSYEPSYEQPPFNMVAERAGSNQWRRRPDVRGGLEPRYNEQAFRRRARFHYERRQARKQLRVHDKIFEEIYEMRAKFEQLADDVRAMMRTSRMCGSLATSPVDGTPPQALEGGSLATSACGGAAF